jgi:hypothetical protein
VNAFGVECQTLSFESQLQIEFGYNRSVGGRGLSYFDVDGAWYRHNGGDSIPGEILRLGVGSLIRFRKDGALGGKNFFEPRTASDRLGLAGNGSDWAWAARLGAKRPEP